MARLEISRLQARRFLVAHQGLGSEYEFAGTRGILDYVRRVGSIQYDALDVVGRNPDLVLQARVHDYRPSMLQDLLYRERRLLDCVDKEMSIYGIEDWPYFRRRRQAAMRRFGHQSRPIVPYLQEILEKINDVGPVASNDLDLNKIVDWPWASTRVSRAALESMYLWGELIIHHKVDSRKTYDFASRHIAEAILAAPDPNQTEEQYHDWYILRRIGSIGLLWNRSGEMWSGIPEFHSPERRDSLRRLFDREEITEIRVDGIKLPFYMRSADRPVLDGLSETDHGPPRAAVLAPLDNLIWDRTMIEEVFGFDYRWEVYKPVAQRRYGYYVLPVLCGDQFIARFEPVKDKRTRCLTIKNWWWEPGVHQSEEVRLSLQKCFDHLLLYLGIDSLEV